MVRPIKVQKSHIGKIFQLIAEQGEDTRLHAVFRRDSGELVGTYCVDHIERDGYGGMVWVFQQLGVKFEAPAPKPAEPPSRVVRGLALLRFLARKRYPALRMRKRDLDWRNSQRRSLQVGTTLTRAETSALLARAKSSKISVSSLVLHALNRSIAPEVVEDTSSVVWALPVNMRGPVRIEPELGNGSALVTVPVLQHDSARDLDRVVRRLLASGEHWAKWDQMNFMGRSERLARKQLASYYMKPDAARIGVFSNIAIWKADLPEDVGLTVYGAATLVDPLFVTAITLNGRMGFGLRVHPSLGATQADVERWFSRWIDALGVRESAAVHAVSS